MSCLPHKEFMTSMKGLVLASLTCCLIVLFASILIADSRHSNGGSSHSRISGKQADSPYKVLHSTVLKVRKSFGYTMGWFNTKIFENANDIPSEYLKEKREIKGVVVKVTDGDTVRVRHVTSGHPASEFTGKFVEQSIAIRIAAVDSPEIAKGKSTGQPYGQEAKDFTTTALLGKKVTIKLLSRDQYGRVLGLVRYRDNTILPNFLCGKKDISEQLLLKGLAVVYRSGGAQYDGSVERWNILEQQAIRAKRGLWKNGAKKADLPSDYKRKSRENTNSKKREFTQV